MFYILTLYQAAYVMSVKCEHTLDQLKFLLCYCITF